MVRIKSKISLMIFGILLLSLYFCINPLYIDFQGKVLIKSNELNKKYIKLSDILPIGKGQLSAYLILDSEERNKLPNNIIHCKILYTDDTTIVKKLLNITKRQQRINVAISKTRYKVERTFGSMHRWFGAGIARYVGLSKTHAQHIMESIAYNLYRTPGIIVSNSIR